MNPTVDWPEMTAFGFLIMGIFLALFSRNALILYAVCFLIGLMFGRMWYKLRGSQCIPLSFVIMGFFLGFILGGIWANLRIISIALLAGILLGYWIHEKKLIRTF